ncbi:MAG: large conductance mechanosensitive channel protein MscL [Deltaproteobacteria bacterium]|nr:large conductance mechanosensitive channel protein MscL [Deltaproteobacteria bacterium]
MLKGFKDFILRGNVVDLAVAVIIGGAFGAVVKSMVEDVITPAIGAVVGKPEFDIMLGPIKLGAFLNALISFLFVAAAVYFMIVVPVKKLTERKKVEAAAPAAPPEPSEEVKLLREIRDSLKK